MAGKRWTQSDDEKLRSLYSQYTAKQLTSHFPDRTPEAIQIRAGHLGLTSKPEVWKKDRRRCARCKRWKRFDEFYKNKAEKHGLMIYCKECSRHKNKQSRQDQYPWMLKRKYGMCLEQFEHLYLQQKGRCAICGKSIWRSGPQSGRGNITICVDHDHKTGKVRGLLCVKCNGGLGQFRDRIDLLENAKQYLLNSSRTNVCPTPQTTSNSGQKE